ncbi:MAG: cholest-4-en-3-one 26-monooxygenase [Actinomycetota bacterium]
MAAETRIDFLSGKFLVDAREAYAWMRANAPVYLDESNNVWGVATYDGVVAVERDPTTFSSAGGSRAETGPLPWMIDMDGDAHTKRRRLVSRGFTPARVRAMEPKITAICDDLINAVCERGACDVVADLAAPLPMVVIGDMLGVEPADRAAVLGWSNEMLASLSGDDEGLARAAAGFAAYNEYAENQIARRRAQPTDDLFSVLVHAEVDGAALTDFEIVFESLLLLIGGDETTRQVTSGGLEQLALHPDQRTALAADAAAMPGAVEEMLRWVSPIKTMARTVTHDVELSGVSLPAGAKLVLLYAAANFDPAHFEHPDVFDITRTPNDHVAFGFGAHYCLGASLARMEVRTMVDRVLQRLPDLAFASDTRPRTITGIQRMPVVFTPTERVR